MSKRGDGFIKGTLFGALVGGIAALLLAPKSGKETQADIKRAAGRAKQDIDQMLQDVINELAGRIDGLKDAARDLRGEAREESGELISRAEVLKRDLQGSAANLKKSGAAVKDSTVQDARRLINEGSDVMAELERVTRKLLGSARDKMRRPEGDDDNSYELGGNRPSGNGNSNQ